MIKEFFSVENIIFEHREALSVSGLGEYSLSDTLLCGQCFRYELITEREGYVEYLIPTRSTLIRVGQRCRGELLFFGMDSATLREVAIPFFTLDTDYAQIKRDILSRTDSEWLASAAECAGGIAILRQEPWEALFSFIISQNNNIPRIRKIIRELSAAYGVNLCLQNGIDKCPCGKIDGTPCEEKCKSCGICYSFPKAADVVKNPDLMLPSRPGFRYRYLLDAAEKVTRGEVDLESLAEKGDYDLAVAELSKITGVGLKVASCTALFGLGCLDAFPIDVWMKRAIDTYFDGKLDHKSLGKYAGVAQQYIFHYIRNLQEEK